MRITKAVVAVAGYGTRFLPVTKALPKEMLPIVDKPVIQYVVEELVASGITDIVFVTGQNKRAVEDHFDYHPELESWLSKTGKQKELDAIRKIAELANFIYIRQKGPYGNGTPVLNVKHLIGDEPFVYAFSDDLVLSEEPFTKNMISAYEKKQGIYLGVTDVAEEEVKKYGIVERADKNGTQIKSIVEKPDPKSTPSRLAVFGRYVLTPDIFAALENIPLGKGGELWIADGIEYLLKKGQAAHFVKIQDGQWYTTGDPISYLKAVKAFALVHPNYGGQAKDIFLT
ncbi:MAG: UTP--glucose-1-phosphate uridylyltransferase [bacterium]|nr:UTP--glucose-1-phosphate uridylyltransferase [bacterium]